MSYCDVLFDLQIKYAATPYTVLALAARYIIGADSDDDLERCVMPRGEYASSILSPSECRWIVAVRKDYAVASVN